MIQEEMSVIMEDRENYLFDYSKLTGLSGWTEINIQLVSRKTLARPLRRSDYDTGYLNILSELTTVGEIDVDSFKKRFDLMKSLNQIHDHYSIVVLEDIDTGKIIAASTLFLELKFIHECATRGRVEEVVVHEDYRGRRLGDLVVRIIVELAREVYKCYKLTLDCTDKLIDFYKRNNFSYGSNMLCIRFDH